MKKLLLSLIFLAGCTTPPMTEYRETRYLYPKINQYQDIRTYMFQHFNQDGMGIQYEDEMSGTIIARSRVACKEVPGGEVRFKIKAQHPQQRLNVEFSEISDTKKKKFKYTEDYDVRTCLMRVFIPFADAFSDYGGAKSPYIPYSKPK